MFLNNQYEIKIVVIEIKEDGNTGDCYDSFTEFKKEHLKSSYKFGFVVIETATGFIPYGYDDWYDSVDEALNAWMINSKWR